MYEDTIKCFIEHWQNFEGDSVLNWEMWSDFKSGVICWIINICKNSECCILNELEPFY